MLRSNFKGDNVWNDITKDLAFRMHRDKVITALASRRSHHGMISIIMTLQPWHCIPLHQNPNTILQQVIKGITPDAHKPYTGNARDAHKPGFSPKARRPATASSSHNPHKQQPRSPAKHRNSIESPRRTTKPERNESAAPSPYEHGNGHASTGSHSHWSAQKRAQNNSSDDHESRLVRVASRPDDTTMGRVGSAYNGDKLWTEIDKLRAFVLHQEKIIQSQMREAQDIQRQLPIQYASPRAKRISPLKTHTRMPSS
jgi:hypothetical protein